MNEMESPAKQQKLDSESNQTPLLVWLDSSVDGSQENNDAQGHLRMVDPNLKVFKHSDECGDFIRSNSEVNQIVLIVSGGLGQTFVPTIAEEEKILSIYVYCGDREKHEIWAVNYSKIRLVTNKLPELIERIRMNDFSDTKPIVEEPIEENETNGVGAGIYEFNNRHIIADLSLSYLSKMKHETIDKDHFIGLCQKEIGQDPTRHAIIQQFQVDVSNRILSWFNRDLIFNQVLLKAFQYLNIENMYACRYFIQTIQKYFDEHKHTSSVQVYRCATMSNELLREMKACEGKIIGIKSVFTTTCDRSMAVYCNSQQDLQKTVLFEIDADPNIAGVKPFVKTSPSYEPGLQDGVVFMIGSLFKINQIVEEENDVTIIQMTLCANELIDSLNNKFINDNQEKDFIGFVQLQYNLSKDLQYLEPLNNADKILENYVKNSVSDDSNRIRVYDLLGNIFAFKKQWENSLVWYNKALNLKDKNSQTNMPNVIESYYYIASVYLNKNDYEQTLNYLNQVLTLLKQIYGEYNPLLIQCYTRITEVYEMQNKFADALIYYNQMFNIMLKHFAIDDSRLAFLYNNIGNTFFSLGQYSLALGYYRTSLDLKLKHQYPKEYIAANYKSIGFVHKSMGNTDEARNYFEQSITKYNELEPPNQNIISEIQELIQNLST